MSLPSLGRIEPPATRPAAKLPDQSSVAAEILGPPPELPSAAATAAWHQADALTSGPQHYAGSREKTPGELAFQRRLTGAVFAKSSDGSFDGARPNVASAPSAIPASDPRGSVDGRASDSGGLGELLRPSVTPAVQARVLPTRQLLLSKGAFIDCTLETAIDSTLPGMTTCVTATDTFSVDGTVVLLERGTKLVGETRGQVQQGAARLFVLWTEARTPTGVVVPLASPGTDELGRSGLPGVVNRHFWDRFGAAILVSVIDGAVQTAVASTRNGGGTVIVSPSTSQDIMTEVLKSTISIPPTVNKAQGDRIQVLVARDLDFRSVYELRPLTAANPQGEDVR